MVLLVGLLLANAWAQGLVELREGETQLAGCLQDPECGPPAVEFLSRTMADAGLTLQRDPLGSSALVNRGVGVVTEVSLDSLPLGGIRATDGTPLLPGLIPILPRFSAGYQLGSYTYDDPYPQVAGAVFALPPIRVGGMAALSTGADLSVAWPVGGHHLWFGLDASYAFTGVSAELVGTSEQLTALPMFGDTIDPGAVAEACADRVCRDRVRVQSGTLRGGVAVDIVPALTLFARAGVVALHNSLWVDWDETRWVQTGLQPQLQTGLAVRVDDKLQIGAGFTAASRPLALGEDQRLAAKAVGALAYRWGAHRYWYRDPRAYGGE